MVKKIKQESFNCKHLECCMDGCYCRIGKGHGYGWCVLPYHTDECTFFEAKAERKQKVQPKQEEVFSKDSAKTALLEVLKYARLNREKTGHYELFVEDLEAIMEKFGIDTLR